MISFLKPLTQIEPRENMSEMIAIASDEPVASRNETCSTVCGASSAKVVKKVSASSREVGKPSYLPSRHGMSFSTSRLVSASTSMHE